MRASLRITRALLALAVAGCTNLDPLTDPVDAGMTPAPPDAAVAEVPDAGTTAASCKTAPSMELGSGVREYLPVKAGDTVYLYKGPQGGYMIYLSVRATGMDPSDVRLCYTEEFTASGRS